MSPIKADSTISAIELKIALTAALNSAWHESLGDDQDFPLGPRHRARSSRFICQFGLLLDSKYKGDQYEVHWKREGKAVYRRGEVLHDFDVFAVDDDAILEKNIWQIESEFAYTGRKPLYPRPRKDKLIEDLNKLICGCAENSLLITSVEWLTDKREWFLSTVRKAAIRWYSLNATNANSCFYVAMIPFVSKWHALSEKELQSVLLKFNLETNNFDTVE